MAFDQPTRNRLQKFVSDARDLLVKEFTRQLQYEYGMDPATGEVSGLDRLTHLDDSRRETARLLRDTLDHYLAGSPSRDVKECLDRIVREQAFTVLNRLCALRMAEARGILVESIGNGYKSRGFQLYARLAGAALGETGDAYRCYLFSVFDEFALDLAVLFDRFSPQGRLFPGEPVLLELLNLINHPDITPLWAEDETIGWIYQCFNSPEERRQMRAESQAPRNSRELAVRNQFFTPRYVVEFLTDNTLGRIWYEMTRGNTGLKDQCRYLVRRPNEIFLAEGEEAPQQDEPAENLSQEELLKQPVYIPYRQLKDPREIRMLYPACGSMHFGLYAFDLFEKIYEEAWELEGRPDAGVFDRSEEFKPLRETYGSKEAMMRDVPRLIIEHNVHGIDIDPRAVQIAVLSLWLRAQRSWQTQGIKPQDRPRISKSNVVCAEPMPGDKEMLREFIKDFKPRVLGQLVEIIFDKMQLAGEAGSLLKIEEEIEEAVAKAREEFTKELLRRKDAEESLFPDFLPPRQLTLFDFTDLPDKTQFWNDAEQKILNALREYAEQAETTCANQKRLFAQDTA
ncbi:MAG: SAM-dependent methyltransferase, partial [Firmicutes bacterium]|nr:SAM-dependent methyltransferase [Bacillota bacterium]